jgi:hypothetical protein
MSESKNRWNTLRPWLVIGTFVVGLALLVAGWLVQTASPVSADIKSYLPSVLANLGTTVFLAALLVWFERVVLKEARTEAKAVITEAVPGIEARAVKAAEDKVSGRLEDIRAQYDQWVEEDSTTGRDTVRKLVENVTFEQVAESLHRCTEIHAIEAGGESYVGVTGFLDFTSWGKITVPASKEPWRASVRFEYGREEPDGRVIIFVRPVLDTRKYVEVSWSRTEPAIEMLKALRQSLTAEGHATFAKTIDLEVMFQNLSTALEVAFTSRSQLDGAMFGSEEVYEMLTDELFVTGAGIAHKVLGLLTRKADFGSWRNGSLVGYQVREDAPEGITQEDWNGAVLRGRYHLTGSRNF